MSANKMRVDRLLKFLSEEGHPFNNLTYGKYKSEDESISVEKHINGITQGKCMFAGTVEMLNKYAGVENKPFDHILTDFYSKWYSANLMCMVVLGSGK